MYFYSSSHNVSHPGGCELGARPIDLHIKALKELGVEIKEEYGTMECEAKKLVGARIYLDFPSVGATENIMLAAVFCQGTTIISNAAKEPEIVDLQNLLNAMGAKIKGAGTDIICIDGVTTLNKVEYTVMPDRIVAGTFLMAAAITKGEIYVNNVLPHHLYSVTSKLAEAGCIIKEESNRIYLKGPEKLLSIDRVRTSPHPGFPTDLQPQMMALLSVAQGTSVICETVFESRMKHVGELNRLGADIVLSDDGMTAIVKGVGLLKGTEVESKDLRGGAALIMAGLAAEGNTVVTGVKHIERGYENIDEALRNLGCDIKSIERA